MEEGNRRRIDEMVAERCLNEAKVMMMADGINWMPGEAARERSERRLALLTTNESVLLDSIEDEKKETTATKVNDLMSELGLLVVAIERKENIGYRARRSKKIRDRCFDFDPPRASTEAYELVVPEAYLCFGLDRAKKKKLQRSFSDFRAFFCS
jgi:hypothetical protein